MMSTELKYKNVFEALTVAQSEMGPVVKGSTNPHFKSKYADLAEVMNVALPALNRHGLCLFHSMLHIEGHDYVRTTVCHGASETSIFCDVPLIVTKNDMQGMKSAVTYAKRIGAESVTGIAPEDDDGNAAAKAAPNKTPPPPQQAPAETKYTGTDAQKKILRGVMSQEKVTNENMMAQIHAACMNKPIADIRKITQDIRDGYEDDDRDKY